VTAYLNGVKVEGVGGSSGTLHNFPITLVREEYKSPDEAK
jgi:hypothetical protein